MSIKVNAYLRDAIVALIVAHRFDEEIRNTKSEQQHVAELVYRELYPPNIVEKMKEFPEYFFNRASVIYLYSPTEDDENDYVRITFDHPVLVSANRPDEDFFQNQKLYDWAKQLENRRSELQDERSQAIRELTKVIRIGTSVSSLVGQWPEIAPLVEKAVSQTSLGPTPTNPLFIRKEDLNQKYRLPPKELA